MTIVSISLQQMLSANNCNLTILIDGPVQNGLKFKLTTTSTCPMLSALAKNGSTVPSLRVVFVLIEKMSFLAVAMQIHLVSENDACEKI